MKKPEHPRLAASVHASSAPIRWSVVKIKIHQNFAQPGLSSPNEVKLHFAFRCCQEVAWLIGFAELPLSHLPALSSASPSVPKLSPVPVTLNMERKTERESIDQLSGTKKKSLRSDL